jgi:hypothetical protein
MKMHDGDILPVELMARREDWSEGISIYMRQQTVGHGDSVAAPVTMVRREPGSIVEPMLRLGIQSSQQLMDELWQCGLRPTEGTGSAGSLKATENHLADMKRIAFTLLERPNVEITG